MHGDCKRHWCWYNVEYEIDPLCFIILYYLNILFGLCLCNMQLIRLLHCWFDNCMYKSIKYYMWHIRVNIGDAQNMFDVYDFGSNLDVNFYFNFFLKFNLLFK